jgi:ubiquitin
MAERKTTPTSYNEQSTSPQEMQSCCPRCGHELGDLALRAATSQTEDERPSTGHELDLPPPNGLELGMSNSEVQEVDATGSQSKPAQPPIPKNRFVFKASGRKKVLRGRVMRPHMTREDKAQLEEVLRYLGQQGVSQGEIRAIRRLYSKGFAVSAFVPTASAAPSSVAKKHNRAGRAQRTA